MNIKIPESIVNSNKISDGEFRILMNCRLLEIKGHSKVTIQDLVNETGTSYFTARKHLKNLSRKSFLIKEKDFRLYFSINKELFV